MASAGVKRGFLGALLDTVVTWYLWLPREQCSYSVQEVRIPMRDGVELVGDLYEPDKLSDDGKPAGMLLVQGCYGRGLSMALLNARAFASRGYRCLLVSCRGTFGSGGEFRPGMDEMADGQDMVAWMRRQRWYPGSFATVGASYLGYSQWALLHDPPPECVAAAILAGPHDYGRHGWGTGSFRLDRVRWADAIAHQEDPGPRLGLPTARAATNAAAIRKVCLGVPLLDSVRSYFGNLAPFISESLEHPDLEDPYWAATQHDAALQRVEIPVLLVSGWYDTFTEQTMEQYRRLHERGCEVALTVGPWTHLGATGLNSMKDVLDFFGEHVAGTTAARHPRPQPVSVYVAGVEEWRDVPSWPPATAPSTFYLQSEAGLGREEPSADAAPASVTYDPADPTPTIGGPLLSRGGRVDDSALATRPDVLVFTSPMLEGDVEILGKPVVHLAHSSDIPFADLFVRLSEVDSAGVSHNITEAFQALDPTRDRSAPAPVELGLTDCAHRFRKGTRIRLIVAGGSFPMFARNMGVEGNRAVASTMRPARHTLALAAGQSRLVLPAAVLAS